MMSEMRKYLLLLAVVAVVAILIALLTGWPLPYVACALFIGWPVIGTLMTIDDDLPGGWSNSDGTSVPEWKTLDWHADILLCRGSLVVVALAFESRHAAPSAVALAALAVIMAYLGFSRLVSAFSKRRPAIDS